MRAAPRTLSVLAFGFLTPLIFAHHCHHHYDCDDCGCGGGPCYRDHHASGGWNYGPPAAAPAAAGQTLNGTISEIVYLPGATSDDGMVEAWIATSGQRVLVRLAPSGLLKQKRILLREGDAVSVTGYRVSAMEGDLVVATEVRKGAERVTLRDSRGRLIR